MSVLHIWPEEPVRRDGCVTVSSTIEAPGKDRKQLWYSIPESQEANLAANADPLVIGAIYLIMQSGHDVQVHGEVSPSLLCNLDEFQAAWTAWIPGPKKVTILADHEDKPAFTQKRNESVVTFSGGVDSCFTAYSQVQAYVRPNPCHLTAGVMVQGFDIPLNQPEVFASAVKQSRILLSSLGLELIPIATNYREVVTDWVHSFGAAAASCLSLFSGRFRVGFISQGFTYSEFQLLREGSNPLTDALLSSDSFRIVPAGTEFARASKIYAMRDWEEFLRYLRVCWEGPQKDRNCCNCEKCMRNILTFRALGLGLPPCFEHDISLQQIRTLRMGDRILRNVRYDALLPLAKACGTAGLWTDVLAKRLAAERRAEDSKLLHMYHRYRRRASKLLAGLRHNGD